MFFASRNIVEYKISDKCYKYVTFVFQKGDIHIEHSNKIMGAFYCDYNIEFNENVKKYIEYFYNRFANKINMTKKSYIELPIMEAK